MKLICYPIFREEMMHLETFEVEEFKKISFDFDKNIKSLINFLLEKIVDTKINIVTSPPRTQEDIKNKLSSKLGL